MLNNRDRKYSKYLSSRNLSRSFSVSGPNTDLVINYLDGNSGPKLGPKNEMATLSQPREAGRQRCAAASERPGSLVPRSKSPVQDRIGHRRLSASARAKSSHQTAARVARARYAAHTLALGLSSPTPEGQCGVLVCRGNGGWNPAAAAAPGDPSYHVVSGHRPIQLCSKPLSAQVQDGEFAHCRIFCWPARRAVGEHRKRTQ
jgi:hypothetical protein